MYSMGGDIRGTLVLVDFSVEAHENFILSASSSFS